MSSNFSHAAARMASSVTESAKDLTRRSSSKARVENASSNDSTDWDKITRNNNSKPCLAYADGFEAPLHSSKPQPPGGEPSGDAMTENQTQNFQRRVKALQSSEHESIKKTANEMWDRFQAFGGHTVQKKWPMVLTRLEARERYETREQTQEEATQEGDEEDATEEDVAEESYAGEDHGGMKKSVSWGANTEFKLDEGGSSTGVGRFKKMFRK
jgi:hypothetical protein